METPGGGDGSRKNIQALQAAKRALKFIDLDDDIDFIFVDFGTTAEAQIGDE